MTVCQDGHMTTTSHTGSPAQYLCKKCGAESPAGIGYVVNSPYVLPAPAANCPNLHA